MADQSSSRPKWIPVYEHREFQSGKEHTTKWSNEIFVNGPGELIHAVNVSFTFFTCFLTCELIMQWYRKKSSFRD